MDEEIKEKPEEKEDVKQENKEKEEEKKKGILKEGKKSGKIKMSIYANGDVYLSGKNVNDNDELPLFLVTYGINLMLRKDVKPSYILNGILSYKPFKEKMIVENHEKENNDNAGSLSMQGVNPLMGMFGSMMAQSMNDNKEEIQDAEEIKENKENN